MKLETKYGIVEVVNSMVDNGCNTISDGVTIKFNGEIRDLVGYCMDFDEPTELEYNIGVTEDLIETYFGDSII